MPRKQAAFVATLDSNRNSLQKGGSAHIAPLGNQIGRYEEIPSALIMLFQLSNTNYKHIIIIKYFPQQLLYPMTQASISTQTMF